MPIGIVDGVRDAESVRAQVVSSAGGCWGERLTEIVERKPGHVVMR
jgi:hypothetical protein